MTEAEAIDPAALNAEAEGEATDPAPADAQAEEADSELLSEGGADKAATARGNCPGGGGAPRYGTTGKGINELWIGQCVGCSEWFNLPTKHAKIPTHSPGHGTYKPFG
jgi:hypothetical protein